MKIIFSGGKKNMKKNKLNLTKASSLAMAGILSLGVSSLTRFTPVENMSAQNRTPIVAAVTDNKVVIVDQLGQIKVLNFEKGFKNFEFDNMTKFLKEHTDVETKTKFDEKVLEQIVLNVVNSKNEVVYTTNLKALQEAQAKKEKIALDKSKIKDGKISFKLQTAKGVDAKTFAYNLEASRIMLKIEQGQDKTYNLNAYVLLADKSLTKEDTAPSVSTDTETETPDVEKTTSEIGTQTEEGSLTQPSKTEVGTQTEDKEKKPEVTKTESTTAPTKAKVEKPDDQKVKEEKEKKAREEAQKKAEAEKKAKEAKEKKAKDASTQTESKPVQKKVTDASTQTESKQKTATKSTQTEKKKSLKMFVSEAKYESEDEAKKAAEEALKTDHGYNSYTVEKDKNGKWKYTLSEEKVKVSEKTYKTEAEAKKAAEAALKEDKAFKSYRVIKNSDGSWSYILSDQAAQRKPVVLKTAATDPSTVGKLGAFVSMLTSLIGGAGLYLRKKK